MISPRTQWCHHAEVSTGCSRRCSNCSRGIGHDNPHFMTPAEMEKIVRVARSFVYANTPTFEGRRRLIGIMGGEPCLSPHFPEYVDILCDHVPEPIHRGLWTSVDWPHYQHPKYGAVKEHVIRLLGPRPSGSIMPDASGGYLNWNSHGETYPPNEFGLRPCDDGKQVRHQPILVASKDIVKDDKQRWELISNCWVQTTWSGSYSKDGFYFCECAAVIDRLFNGGVNAIPLSPGVWDHDLTFETDALGVKRPVGKYAKQIMACCERCGACVPLPGRLDSESVDDISRSNLVELEMLKSPKVRRGKYVLYSDEWKPDATGKWQPNRYVQPKENRDGD